MVKSVGFGRRKLIQEIISQNWKIKNPEDKKYNYNELLFIIQEMLEEEGKGYLQKGGSIMRGHSVFRDFVKHLLYRNIANYDSMVLITSDKGTGKSSAAMTLAREWCRLLGIRFNPDRHIAYNNSDMMNKIDNLNHFEPIIADEAVRFATSADWAKKEHKQLKKKLAQVRTKHLFYILCFPLKVVKLEKTYLESFTNYWIDLYARGQGVIYVKDKNPLQDSWRLSMFKDVGSYTEFTSSTQIADKLKKHSNFWSLIRFPKPPEWLYSRYIKIREKNVYDDENVLQNVSKEDIHNALLVLSLRDIMMHDSTLSMSRILLHISSEYDVKLNKAQLTRAIEDAKQLVIKVREKAIEA